MTFHIDRGILPCTRFLKYLNTPQKRGTSRVNAARFLPHAGLLMADYEGIWTLESTEK